MLAITFAGLHEFETVGRNSDTKAERWHELTHSLVHRMCEGKSDMHGEGGGFDDDPTRMLRNLSVPKKNNELGVTLSPLAHAMFHSMYVTRKVFMLDETVDDSRVDEATMQAAWIVIDEKAAKYEKYHRLWRKWLVLWTTVSRWTTATGEGSGSIERPVGEAAVAAFDADMGDNSVAWPWAAW